MMIRFQHLALFALLSLLCYTAIDVRLYGFVAVSDEGSTGTETETKNDFVWIMSFGGSGTSYTIQTVETATGFTTASNYGADFDASVPGITPQGPFWRSPHKAKAQQALTKTHCGGYCMSCTDYVHTPTSFEKACRTGTRPGGEAVTYEPTPTKVVHLIRNPMDNLVGRMHLAQKRQAKAGKDHLANLENTRDGFLDWCRTVDEKRRPKELEPFTNVPCAAEWYRYVQWHNLAYQTHAHWTTHYVYYEDYAKPQTIQGLLDFLGQPQVHAILPFRAGQSYQHMFSAEDRAAVQAMVQQLALPPVWKLLQRYFEPQVAWLLSFPNSVGTGPHAYHHPHCSSLTHPRPRARRTRSSTRNA